MSIFKTYTPEQIDAHLQHFIITSWSYSKVENFARNQKSFEMSYIYGMKSKSGASAVAGNAYHEALKAFFTEYKEGTVLTLMDLEQVAWGYLEKQNTNFWKLQKKTPTVQDFYNTALKNTNALLKNFFAEIGTYIDEIEEVIEIEVYCNEWLTVNGFDVDLPCHLKIDLIVKLKNGNIAILDHKSKDKFSDEKELKLSIGKQAVTYVLGYESKSGLNIDEVWFIENKVSQNQDGSKQLNAFKVILNKDTRRLYEHMLYSPLKAMMQAITNPDHDYILNEADNWVDKAELYEFWMRTMICEVTDLDIVPSKRDMVEKRLRKIRDVSLGSIDPKLIRDFQKSASQFIQYDLSNMNATPAEKIVHALQTFNIKVEVPFTFEGWSSNTFLLNVNAGTKIVSIHSRALDIANMIDVPSVRIPKELVMHNDKSYVAVEFAKKRDKDLFWNPADLDGMKIPLGKDNFGNIIYWDLDNHATTNVLIGGAVGSGKSVSMISTLEYMLLAGVDDITIYDPKYEFIKYRSSKIKVLNEIIEIEEDMANQVQKMNGMIKSGEKKRRFLLFDEFADAISMSRKGKELDLIEEVQVGTYAPKKFMGIPMPPEPKMANKKVGELKSLEENFRVLIQKGRSTGLRTMAGTQRASAKIINGDTKVNFPIVICYLVPKAVDSQVMLDESGAEFLQGYGDGLIKSPTLKDITRFQAYYKPE